MSGGLKMAANGRFERFYDAGYFKGPKISSYFLKSLWQKPVTYEREMLRIGRPGRDVNRALAAE